MARNNLLIIRHKASDLSTLVLLYSVILFAPSWTVGCFFFRSDLVMNGETLFCLYRCLVTYCWNPERRTFIAITIFAALFKA